ncbi:hypothetical protein ACQJBY_051808 [Aegilops geniculata]
MSAPPSLLLCLNLPAGNLGFQRAGAHRDPLARGCDGNGLAECPWRMAAAAATAREAYVACRASALRERVGKEDFEGETDVLLDPSTLRNDAAIALSTYSISEDGK